MTSLEKTRIEEHKARFELSLLVYKVLDLPNELCTGAWIEMPGTLPSDLVVSNDLDGREVWYGFEYDGEVWQLRKVVRNVCGRDPSRGSVTLPRSAVEYLLRSHEAAAHKLVKDLVQIYDGEETKNGG